jgi:two-component system chemotaxis response regulator CheB
VSEVDALPSHVIAVAASAGGVEALRTLVSDLPGDLDAAVCVVLHIPASGRSLLAPILDRYSALDAAVADDGAPLRRGAIYVAPADQHLLIRGDHVELSRGPRENGVRPAADPMFRSLARAWRVRGIAVVLSGALDDGAAGVAAVAAEGGRVIVQSPGDALVDGMPASAIAATEPDAVLPVREIGARLVRLVTEPQAPDPEEPTVSPDPDPADLAAVSTRPDGAPSGFTCPECRGPMWESREDALARYRCRVGHAYSEQVMVEAQGGAVEAALWTALEVLQERSELLNRIADCMHAGQARTEHTFREAARQADERAAVIRRVLAMGEDLLEEVG